MDRRHLALTAFLAAASLAAFAFAPAGDARSQDVQQVEVVNLPAVQKVSGEVSIQGTVPHARFLRLGETVVPPASLDDPDQLVPGELLDTAGFTRVVLSFTGEVRGTPAAGGRVGALLVPDEEPVARALREAKAYPLALRAAGGMDKGSQVVWGQGEGTVGFPRYRVLYWNDGDRPVAIRLYAYLAN